MTDVEAVIEVFEVGDHDSHRRPHPASFVVTVRTVAGFRHRFRVRPDTRVATVMARAVDFFADRGELARGNYMLVEDTADASVRDLVDSATLQDSGVRANAQLALMSTDPMVDG